jgi:two-component system phosphate regulon sensor histidine kinase PhoR
MASFLRRSLFLALLWRAAVGVAAISGLLLWLPQVWMAVIAGCVAAIWMAWGSTSAVRRGMEELEPVAASICDSPPSELQRANLQRGNLPPGNLPPGNLQGGEARPDLPWQPAFREMEGLVDALQACSSEVARRLAASSESRRKLEALLDSMQDAVTSVDAGGRIVWANQPMQRLIAESSGTVRAGRSLVQTIRAPEVLECVQAALEGGRYAEARPVSLPIGRTFAVSAAPMPEGGAVVVLQDVTRIEQVERTQREFVANVSHELRTPLTTISGYVETLLDDERTGLSVIPEAREFLEAIYKSARRMARLTDDLLVMTRVDSGEQKLRPEPVEVAILLREAEDAVAALVFEKQGELDIGSCPDVEVLADLDAIVQVLSNLIENALNYGRGPGGALVVLSAEVLPPAAKFDLPQEVRFCVQDFGSGIASEHLGRLFERFYRVDKARSRDSGGTGLGLAIARHIVEVHRGRLWVESELGRGSKFCFTLPCAPLLVELAAD